jgi:parvulin-like peptidyl-prolyl isomerase
VSGDTKLLDRSFNSFGRSNFLIGALLRARVGDVIGPINTTRGYGIVKVVDVSAIDSSDFEIKRDVIYKNIHSQRQSENFQNWYQDLLDQAEIVDNRKFYF